MKKLISRILIVCLLFLSFQSAFSFTANAAGKREQPKKSIAIVFDNSWSMYIGDEERQKAWSRATYAMEVFAAMLNEGDVLSIYPMHEIMVGDAKYSQTAPFRITSPDQSSKIREIFTPNAQGTPIESITMAHDGLMKEHGERWLVILTDGESFYRNGGDMGRAATEVALKNECLEPYSKDMNVLYLGIGANAVKPECQAQGEYHLMVERVNDSVGILSKLTAMCNIIFGRDTLPASHFSNKKTINADISISKLIVFAQGENISNVTLTDGKGKTVSSKSSNQTRYPEKGGQQYNAIGKRTDTSLQGMIMTYEDIPQDTYTLSCSGDVTSLEVYYEPDVDMEFTFTDEFGSTVDPKDLYEGTYKLSYGLKDGKTGEFTTSDLLGTVSYLGHYYINGQPTDFFSDKKQDSENVQLKMGDTFQADLEVTYLSGYRIKKDSESFGWPKEGLTVKPRPAREVRLAISGGQETYQLNSLEDGAPFIAEVYYDNEKLTGSELEKVTLYWSPEDSGAELKYEPKADHFEIVLRHKDPSAPEKTPTGKFTVPITAKYTPPSSEEAESRPSNLAYSIELPPAGDLKVSISGGQAAYPLSTLDDGEPFILEVFYQGQKLSGAELKAVRLEWEPEHGGAVLELSESGDHYVIKPRHNDPSNPAKTPVGTFNVPLTARYTPALCAEAVSPTEILTYTIEDDYVPLLVKLSAPQNYYVIKDIEDGEPIRADLTNEGKRLTAEQFSKVNFTVDTDGLEYTLEPLPNESAYFIHLKKTDNLKEGKYTIKGQASMVDEIGRECVSEDRTKVELSNIPQWVKTLVICGSLVLLALLIFLICRIPALPKTMQTSKQSSKMIVDGDDVSKNWSFPSRRNKNSFDALAQFGGKKVGFSARIKPGEKSYISTKQIKRCAEVDPSSISGKGGNVKITEVKLGSVRFVLNEDTKKLERIPKSDRPIYLRNGNPVAYSGTMKVNGETKDFAATMNLNFKKTK